MPSKHIFGEWLWQLLHDLTPYLWTKNIFITLIFQTSKNKLKNFLRSIATMPSSLNIVCVTNLFAWMSHVNFYFYFTHFVGRSVYDGDPTVSKIPLTELTGLNSQYVTVQVLYFLFLLQASPTTQSYQLYEEGIRFACLALSVNCVASMLYPLVANKLIKKLG